MTRKKLTADEVEQMEEAGLFEDSRFELIDGELIDKMGRKPPHLKAIGLCAKLLRKIFGEDMVHAQAPVSAGAQDRKTSVPEPDVRVLAGDKPDFAYRHPQGPEVALLVEVSDTTLRRDTLTKRDLYARSGVPEYWVLDLKGRRLLVHRDLNIESAQYDSLRIYREDEAVSIASQRFLVSTLLP